MEAERFITSNKLKIDNKEYVQILHEVRDVPITKADWDWLYINIMHDDYECAYDNGIYQTEYDYHKLDCEKVLEQMEIWLEDLKDNDECLQDYNEQFQKTFKEIKELLEQNIDFVISYKEENK